jgi:hypothetical protein
MVSVTCEPSPTDQGANLIERQVRHVGITDLDDLIVGEQPRLFRGYGVDLDNRRRAEGGIHHDADPAVILLRGAGRLRCLFWAGSRK